FVAEGYIVSCEIVDGVSYYTVGKIDTQIPETYVAKAVVTVGEGEDALTYEIYYTSLEDALADATDGETIVILQSCVAEGTYTIEKSLTIDLGGNTVTGGIEVLGSEVKINLEGGKILGDITVEGAATLIMDGSAESDAEPSYGIGTVIGEITVEEGSTLVVEGGAYSRGQEDETYDNYDEVVEGLANGAGVIYVGEITYTDGDDEEKTVTGLTIMDEDTAKTTAEASRTYTDEGGNEITVYYESLEAAVKGLEDGDVLVVLKDVDLTKDEESCTITIEKDVVIDLNGKTLTANIEVSGASVDINLEGGEIKGAVTVEASEEGTSSDVTINLGGGKIDGGISLDETSSLTIIDEGGEILGEVTGKIETAGGSLIVEGGIYSENVLDFVADGKVMYVGKDDSGNKYYVVTTEDVMKEAMEGGGESCYTIGASVTYTDGNGKETTVYFEDPATAIDFAVGLEGALEGTSVTVELYEDLKYEGDGGITTKEGDDITINLNGNTITGDITVADGSSLTIDLGGGSVAGSITVGDTGNETAEKTASLVIEDSSEEKSGSVTGEIKAGENSEESANITIEGGTYYGGDVFDFLGEGKVEYVGKDGESGENYYVVGTGEEIEESDLEIGAKVTYTSAAGETVTIYFEDPADAVDYALSLEGVEEGSVVIVELFDDLDFSENEEGMKVETSYAVEIDLKGNSISGDITVESGSSLTIRDTSGDMSGKVSGNITETSGGAFVAEGGTYSEDVFEFLGDGKVEYVGKDSESQENYYVVGTEAEIENSDLEIGAKVVYKDVGGGIVTVYFEDPVDAIDFAVGLSDVEKGTTVLVELYADLDYTGVTDEKEKEIKGIETKTGSDITINLNGNSIIGDITVKAGSTLTIEDTDPKDYGEGSKVDGEVTIEGGDGEEKAGELKISGGMYTGDITKATLDDGSFVLILTTDEEERISVVADEETAKAYSEVSVEIDGKTVYYEGIDAAIKDILAVLESDDYDGAEIIMTVYGENVVIGEAGFSIPSGSVTIDLNGGELEGSISLGGEDGEGEVSLTFTDSSGDGSGKFEGKVAGGENADITLDGGTYSKDAFEGCEGGLEYGTYENENGEAETYVPVYGSEFIYVVTESEAEIMSVACVEDGDGSREYFTDVEDAIDFAAENGGVVTLYDDAVCRESVEINADVTIDLNGHTLDADIIIYADNDDGQGQGGSLYVTGSKEEGGWLTGEIVVVGSDTSEDGTNPYKETLVLDFDEMDGSLTISVEDKDGKNLENYVFSKTEDGFGIVRADEHTHSYVLAVWNYLGYGKFTLMFKCACGEYDEFLETYTAEATENEDGTVTFTLSVTVMDPSHAGTYEYEKTMSFAAKVSINGETVYFEDLDEAIGAAIESGATLILMCDAEANLNLTDGESLTIDLNGNELSGEIEIEEGASLEIEGVGVVTSEIESYGELIIRGGTYYEDVTDYLDAGYAVMVGTDKDGIATYTVLSESAAKESSEASVTNENGSTIYYESLEDALAALENGCTLTLQADIEEDLIICLTDEDESIEIGLDLNGYEIWGDVIIETGESESFSFEISDSSADGERGYGKILGEIEGADSVTLFGGNFEGDISGFDIAESCAVINNADGSKSVVPEGVAKDLSGAVIEAGENTYYYELLQDAVAAAEGMDEDSFVVMTADCLSDVTITSSVTIDLNGYEIEGDVHVEAEASLTFTDSSAGCEGAVSGDVLGSGDVILSGGTFRADAFKETTYEEGDEEEAEEATESVGVELGKDTIVVVGRGEKGEMVFTVMTEDEAEKFGYTKVETKGEDGGTQTLFFTDFDEAINYAATFGGTVTLYSDEIMLGGVTISAEVEIDLNGHTLCADITVDAVTYPGASLKVTCGSEEGGKITGSLVVIVEDSKGDENPYEETLKISSANDIGNLDVSIVDVAGTAAQNYFLTEDEAESSYVIGMGKHDHAYDIAGWAYDEKTCTFTFILKCACGDVSVTEIINAKFSYDKDTNTVTVSAETETKNTDGEPYTYEVSFTPEAELKIYDEDGEVEGTYYFESLEDAIAYVAALEEARAS
ncbi:MAG: hypothetical protein LUD29_06550, partial [Clostridia bacterium]|nr:hypothetical protein [Clostridia bacterium]